MDGNRVVLDISSDEDVGFKWPATDGCDSDVDWTELFVNLDSDAGDSQNREKGYDSDDVVVVGEVLPKAKRARKSSGVANFTAQHWEKDDDCVILDGDPDKPAVEDKNSGYDSDDLVIVAEKGQVACRDYPHPRHLCVMYPFSSTLHSEHCNLCHCYVCDSPAPCGNWGNGSSVTDHCHATEKEELWKSERKRIKQGGNVPVISSTDPLWKDLYYPAHKLPSTQNGYLLPEQAPSYDPPNIIRSQRNSGLSGRNRYCSNQPINPCSNNLQRARPSSSPHSVTYSPIFKRPRAGIHSASKQSKNHSSLNDFRNSYPNNQLVHNHLASKQAYTSREIHTGQCDGIVNLDPRQDSSAVNASKISAGCTPSECQLTQTQLYVQPTAHANGYPSVNISAPVTSNAHCNTSQQSQCFPEVSDLHGRGQLPVTGEQSWNGLSPDLCNWPYLDNQAFNEFPGLDAEGRVYADYPWTQF